MEDIRILILYNELNGYNMVVFEELLKQPNIKLLVVHNDANKLAPYIPATTENAERITLHSKSKYTKVSLLQEAKIFNPNILFVNGWFDATYRSVARHYKATGIPVISSMDNHYNGTLKQKILTLISFATIRKCFSHFFVPGSFQFEYARRLGYPKEKILMGSLTGNTYQFNKAQALRKEWKKNILYVGRIAPIKRVDWIYDTFVKYADTFPDWTLTIIGNGADPQKFVATDRIRIIDFLDADAIVQYAVDASLFVLTTVHEHFGVVIHEMASAGLPIITTDECGAGYDLVVNDLNGYTFKVDSKEDFERVWVKTLRKTPEELKTMGEHSYELSKRFSPLIWVKKFLSVLD